MNSAHLRLVTTMAVALVVATSGLAPLRAKAEEPADPAPGKPIAEQIIGSWSIDVARTLAAMVQRAEEDNGGQAIEAEQKEGMESMVEEMASNLMLEFKAKGAVTAFRPNENEDATYEILRPDQASGKFAMKIRPAGEEDADMAVCKIDGDTMIMGVEDGKFEIHLKRLTPEQAKTELQNMKGDAEPDDKGDDAENKE